jgi:Animal haem peroxidase
MVETRRTPFAVPVVAALGLLAASFAGAPPAAATGPGNRTACAPAQGYGHLFPRLAPATWYIADLSALSQASMEVTHLDAPGDPAAAEMPNIPAGYTYTGQFIDHDITLDARPDDLTTPVDVATLRNARTPVLDLDSLYGKGPAGSPALYAADGVRLVLGAAQAPVAGDAAPHDLPRDAGGGALLGDSRNDENRIVASLHSLFIRFHNRVADQLAARHPGWSRSRVFAATRRQVTWYYQWAVLTDFLPSLAGQAAVAAVVRRSRGSGWTTRLRFYDPCRVAMPVEFSGAAYRFGHSMVRDDYDINDSHPGVPILGADFSDPTSSLVGFQPAPHDFGIDWHHFFAMGPQTPLSAYKLDNSMVPELRLLPGPDAGAGPTLLATRNLLRGKQLGLPSGQAVARAMGLTPLRDDQIIIGPALGPGLSDTVAAADVSPAFAGNAPLWTYVLAESVNRAYPVAGGRITGPQRAPFALGPVGGRLVTETLVGLLLRDRASILHHGEFRPARGFAEADGSFRFRDIVAIATGEHPIS